MEMHFPPPIDGSLHLSPIESVGTVNNLQDDWNPVLNQDAFIKA